LSWYDKEVRLNEKIPLAMGLVVGGEENDINYPFLDLDTDDLNRIKRGLTNIINKYKLGPYLLLRTCRGYQIHFTHDCDRPDIEEIIQNAPEEVDPDFKRISRWQSWRATRLMGKYIPLEMTLLDEIQTGYKGKGSQNMANLLRAVFKGFWRQR